MCVCVCVCVCVCRTALARAASSLKLTAADTIAPVLPALSVDAGSVGSPIAHTRALLDILSSCQRPFKSTELFLLQALLQYFTDESNRAVLCQDFPRIIELCAHPSIGIVFNFTPECPDLLLIAGKLVLAVCKAGAAPAHAAAVAFVNLLSAERVSVLPAKYPRSLLAAIAAECFATAWTSGSTASESVSEEFLTCASNIVFGSNPGDALLGSSDALRQFVDALVRPLITAVSALFPPPV